MGPSHLIRYQEFYQIWNVLDVDLMLSLSFYKCVFCECISGALVVSLVEH